VRRSAIAALVTGAALLAAPGAASAQAALSLDPQEPCYREQDTIAVLGQGFSPNALVSFARDGAQLGNVQADASGALIASLRLPGLVSGQRQLTYIASDATDPTRTGQVTLLVTATDVGIEPEHGRPNRLLTIRARGFLGGKTLWAHVIRKGRKARTARHVWIGRVRGACKTLKARKRLFPASVAPGRYRIQFDTFRKYRKRRTVKAEYAVTLFPTPAASASRWLLVH
jgi:hypothetical protein